jgi:hypothetical protein
VLHLLEHVEQQGFPFTGGLAFGAGFLEFITQGLDLFAQDVHEGVCRRPRTSFDGVRVRCHTDKFRLIDQAVRRGTDFALINEFVQGTAGDPQLACRVGFRQLGHSRASTSGLQALFDAVQDAHGALKEQRVLGQQLLRPDGILGDPFGALVHLGEDLRLALQHLRLALEYLPLPLQHGAVLCEDLILPLQRELHEPDLLRLQL